MGAINIGARNGGKVKVVAPDNPDIGAEATLPKHTGTLATLEDISNITDLDAEALVNLADQVEENKQDIIELEEEIEAIAPSFDRGEWDYKEPESFPAPPDSKTYHIVNEAGGLAVMYANTHKVVFSNTDVNDDVHTWADVEVGQYLEVFDERDGEFLLAKVDAIQLETTYASFEVTVQKSDGGPRGISGEDEYSHRVRVKFFSLNNDVDLSAYMPKTGGTFTGSIMTDRGNVLIKSNNKNSGTSFRVINGNDVEQLKIDGYGNFEYKRPKGTRSSVDTVARLQDMQTLHSNGNSLRWSSSAGTLSEGFFSTATSSLSSNKKWYFRNLYDYTGGKVNVRDYDALQGCMLEIWKSNTLIVKTVIKNWLNSDRDAYSVMFETSGYKNTVYAAANLNTSDIYSAIITNLRKK